MSNMLDQAIVDANMLREAAMKNAETMIIEKYSDEVRTAVTTLLEEDEELGMDAIADVEAGAEEAESTAMEQVPMSHLSGDGEEEIVMVDLDDIIAAASDQEEDEGEFELDREEISDEIGIDLDMGETPEPANRHDNEVEIDEDVLVNVFKEMLSLEVTEDDQEALVDLADKEEDEEREEIVSRHVDGMDEKEIEHMRRTMAQFESLQQNNKQLKRVLGALKTKLHELHLQNARLLYTNQVLSDSSLNEQQKNKIAEMVRKARSVEEAKTIFETLQKTMAHNHKSAPESLSEAVSRKSSVILSGRRSDESTIDPKAPTLAGLTNN